MGFVKRKNELLIPFLQVIGDLICIECSFLFSYWFRLYSPFTSIVPVTLGFPPLKIYLETTRKKNRVLAFICGFPLFPLLKNYRIVSPMSRAIISLPPSV